jgi:hypothetical protein
MKSESEGSGKKNEIRLTFVEAVDFVRIGCCSLLTRVTRILGRGDQKEEGEHGKGRTEEYERVSRRRVVDEIA